MNWNLLARSILLLDGRMLLRIVHLRLLSVLNWLWSHNWSITLLHRPSCRVSRINNTWYLLSSWDRLLFVLWLSSWWCTSLDYRCSYLLRSGHRCELLLLLELVDDSLSSRWYVRLELMSWLRFDEVDPVLVQVFELLVYQFDLAISQSISASVDEALNCSELINVYHVTISLEIYWVKILRDHSFFNECWISLVQLNLYYWTEDPEKIFC